MNFEKEFGLKQNLNLKKAEENKPAKKQKQSLIDSNFRKNNSKLIIEKNDNNFIKRIGVLNDEMNLSIYFFDCVEIELNEGLFDFNPFIEYVSN